MTVRDLNERGRVRLGVWVIGEEKEGRREK